MLTDLYNKTISWLTKGKNPPSDRFTLIGDSELRKCSRILPVDLLDRAQMVQALAKSEKSDPLLPETQEIIPDMLNYYESHPEKQIINQADYLIFGHYNEVCLLNKSAKANREKAHPDNGRDKTFGSIYNPNIPRPSEICNDTTRYHYYSAPADWMSSEYKGNILNIEKLDLAKGLTTVYSSNLPNEAKIKAIKTLNSATSHKDLEMFKRTDYFVFATSQGHYCLHIMDAQKRAKLADPVNYDGTKYICRI